MQLISMIMQPRYGANVTPGQDGSANSDQACRTRLHTLHALLIAIAASHLTFKSWVSAVGFRACAGLFNVSLFRRIDQLHLRNLGRYRGINSLLYFKKSYAICCVS